MNYSYLYSCILFCILIVRHFKHPPPDVPGASLKKLVNIVAINGHTALESPVAVNRRGPREITPRNGANSGLLRCAKQCFSPRSHHPPKFVSDRHFDSYGSYLVCRDISRKSCQNRERFGDATEQPKFKYAVYIQDR